MIGEDACDGDREAFRGGEVEKLVRTMGVRPGPENARDQELRLGEEISEHGHERDAAAFSHEEGRTVEAGDGSGCRHLP